METTVIYDSYNTLIDKAIIKISETDRYELNISDVSNEDGSVTKKLDIKAINSLVPDGIVLSMAHDEAKQLQLLISQFVISLQKDLNK